MRDPKPSPGAVAGAAISLFLLAVLTIVGLFKYTTWAMQARTWGWVSALALVSVLIFVAVFATERDRH